jgi:hypothetical protein
LGCNELRKESIYVLDSIFAAFTLKSLTINNVGITELQVCEILKSLSTCHILTKLVLKDVPITVENTGRLLAKCISELLKLEDLQIINCGLSPRSMMWLAKEIEPMI